MCRTLDVRCEPVRETHRYIGSIVDVTELKRLEKFQLESAEARAADAQAMRKSLELSVDVTSHELRK